MNEASNPEIKKTPCGEPFDIHSTDCDQCENYHDCVILTFDTQTVTNGVEFK